MLTKTNIEYGDLAWNFYVGCQHKETGVCPVQNCWAEAMSKRQKFNFREPHLIPERLLDPLKRKKPATILVNFMGDLGGEWVDWHQLTEIFDPETREYEFDLEQAVYYVVNSTPHTYFFLTKNPETWGKRPGWPDNCWMGATVCNDKMLAKAEATFSHLNARNKWLSIEPLYGRLTVDRIGEMGLSWLVIGAQSRPNVYPKIEWVREIVEAADRAGVQVWLKNNLSPLIDPEYETNDQLCSVEGVLRQQSPWLK